MQCFYKGKKRRTFLKQGLPYPQMGGGIGIGVGLTWNWDHVVMALVRECWGGVVGTTFSQQL